MSTFVGIFLFVTWIGFLIVRRLQMRRARWLRQLNLPGSWAWDDGDSVLDLSGNHSSGSFLLREAGEQRSGRWLLRGHSLQLFVTKGDAEGYSPYLFDLRTFERDKIGLDGIGRKQRLYSRTSKNVVSLRR